MVFDSARTFVVSHSTHAQVEIISNEEESYVEISRRALTFIGPWQCLVCNKKNESKVRKCGVCGRPRGHETPDEVIQRVWNPQRANSVFTTSSSPSPRARRDEQRKRRQTSPSKPSQVSTITEKKKSTSSAANEDLGTCCICLERPSTHAFVPCGHKCVCKECGDVVMKCPHCRGPKAMLIKIFE